MVMGTFQAGSGEEEISLLMDGELDAARVDAICDNLRQMNCVTTWVCYHVIGDALRGPCATRAGFAARFTERLAAEPTVLAPQRRKTGATAD